MLISSSVLPAKNLFAFDPNASVYVKETDGGDWTPAKYVGERSDCLVLERLRPYPWKESFLKVPSQIIEENVDIGSEVTEKLRHGNLPNSKMPPIVDRVLSVQTNCHEVGFSVFVLPGNIVESTEFIKLRSSENTFSVGDKVYAFEYQLTPEHWSLRTVVAMRDDCYEIDSPDKVLCGSYFDEQYINNSTPLFNIPPKITTVIKKGDSVDSFSRKFFLEGDTRKTAYPTLEGRVKTKTKDSVMLESSNDDCSYDPVKIADVRKIPYPLSKKDFVALKPGDVVLERVDPACCCCNTYYISHKIISQKRSGYLLQRKSGGEIEARIPSQFIPARALKKR
jgi:hypothetical protein